jgi:hypothetical protein
MAVDFPLHLGFRNRSRLTALLLGDSLMLMLMLMLMLLL